MDNTYQDLPYRQVLAEVQHLGVEKSDRTGVGTKSLFGMHMSFGLLQGFPLLTSKAVNLRNVAVELEWMLKGRTDIRYLLERGVRIWSDWPLVRFNQSQVLRDRPKVSKKEFERRILEDDNFSDKYGDLGPVYGAQWRDRNGIDQLAETWQLLRKDPDSRRIIVDAWAPECLREMALPPCHMMYQFYTAPVREDEKESYVAMMARAGIEVKDADIPSRVLHTQMYQRSADLFLGVPYNIASYALLTHLMAKEVGMIPGYLSMTLGDAHIYANHEEAVNTLLERRHVARSPTVVVDQHSHSILSEDFEVNYTLLDYKPQDPIRAPIAV